MGLRGKVIFGIFGLFFILFSFKLLCANCEDILTDGLKDSVGIHRQQHQLLQQIGTSLSVQDPTLQNEGPNAELNNRRRPGRKRKRRPQAYSTEKVDLADHFSQHWKGEYHDGSVSSSDESPVTTYYQQSIPRSPYRTKDNFFSTLPSATKFIQEKIREPLAALEKEQKLFELRDKQRKTTTDNKSYRKPYSQAKKELESLNQDDSSSRQNTDLKNLLKNSGGLSLSELLQKKNLSLDDLLKGKHNALQVIQSSRTSTKKPDTLDYELKKPIRRIPSQFLSPTNPNILYVKSTPEAISSEMNKNIATAIQSRRASTVSPFNSPTEQNYRESITMPSPTRKNIIYPTRFKNKFILASSTSTAETPEDLMDFFDMTESTTLKTTNEEQISTSPRKRINYTPKTTSPSRYRPIYESSTSMTDANETKFTDVQQVEQIEDNDDDSNSTEVGTPQNSVDEKLKETKPNENFIENLEPVSNEMKTLEELFSSSSFRPEAMISYIQKEKNNNPSKIESNPVFFLDLLGEQQVDDRSELLELIEDKYSRNRLFKVLAQRNMTLDELIEHRVRGSSQLHLSQIINDTPNPLLPSDEAKKNLDIVTAFENFPHFNLINLRSVKPDQIKTDSEGSSYFTSISSDVDSNDKNIQHKEGRRSLRGQSTTQSNQPQQQIKISKSINFFRSLPSYASTSRFLEHNLDHHNINLNDNPILRIENEVARAHDILDLELSGHGFKRNNGVESIHLSPGIQSAIVASSVIVSISLLIFLLVFVICRCKHKRKKKTNYLENYSGMKCKLPVISQESTMMQNSNIDVDSFNDSINNNNDNNNFPNHNSNINSLVFQGSRSSSRLSILDPTASELNDYLFESMRKSYQ